MPSPLPQPNLANFWLTFKAQVKCCLSHELIPELIPDLSNRRMSEYEGGRGYDSLITGPKLRFFQLSSFTPIRSHLGSTFKYIQSLITSTATMLVQATIISHLDNAAAYH